MENIYQSQPPMPTQYKGVTFRSRTEARWAVFFDALGIEWQYEPEYFRLSDGEFYKPDFFLPRLHCPAKGTAIHYNPQPHATGVYVEVKPRGADDSMFDKARDFAERFDQTILMLDGGPRFSWFGVVFGKSTHIECQMCKRATFSKKFLPGGSNQDEYRLWVENSVEEPTDDEWLKNYIQAGIQHALTAVSAAVFDEYDGAQPGNDCSVYRNAAVQNQPRC